MQDVLGHNGPMPDISELSPEDLKEMDCQLVQMAMAPFGGIGGNCSLNKDDPFESLFLKIDEDRSGGIDLSEFTGTCLAGLQSMTHGRCARAPQLGVRSWISSSISRGICRST